jgi:CubicO group peptidase (beta-lactamase class C family)
MKLSFCRLTVFACVIVLSVACAVDAQTIFPVPDWQVAKPETQSMSAEGVAKVGAWLKENGSKAGLLVRHGRIVGEWYFDDATPQSRYPVYSTTKSFASTAAGLAIADDKLKLDTKVGELFPDASPPEKREITVRQLLTMTSGAHLDHAVMQRADMFTYVLSSLPMDSKPGEKWVYNNQGLSLLSPMIKKATGKNITELLDEQVFSKVGIRRDDWTWEEKEGMTIPYSGLHITARALARFGLLILNKGQWRGDKVISSTWIAEATRRMPDLTPDGQNKDYGYLWWNNSTRRWSDVPADAFAAQGRFDNTMLIVPSLDLIVLRQVGDDSANNRKVTIEQMFSLAVAAVNDPSPSLKVADTPSDVEVYKAFPNLRFNRPILLTHAGDGSNRVFVPSQLGKIFVFPNDPSVEEPKEFLDIEDRVVYEDKENEKGFLGLAFHPRYRENGQFFVYYTPKGTRKPHTIAVSRFTVSKTNPDQADTSSEERLLEVEQPFWNHKGGTLVFGPDGYLYIALGDGGLANDPFGNGQKLTTMLGKILRIDVDHRDDGKHYAVPSDNPFVGRRDALPEIWAYGLRNPWRIAFDRQTGVLWCGDVGQDLWEEVDLIVKGGNYGWNVREGVHRFGKNGVDPRSDVVEPIWEYHHEVGKSITGGHVYRGKRLPQLVGCYLYADYVGGQVWALKYNEASRQVEANYSIRGNVMPIMSFGEDQAGESYYTTDTGQIYGLRQIEQ